MIESETNSGWTQLENISSTLENLVDEVQQAAISETRSKLKGEWKELQDLMSTRYKITLGISQGIVRSTNMCIVKGRVCVTENTCTFLTYFKKTA